jgi:two-component system, NtrC family, sensor kinase
MPHRLGPKLILSLTVLIVAISVVSGYLNLRTQKKQLLDTMIMGADQLSRSITARPGTPCSTTIAKPRMRSCA